MNRRRLKSRKGTALNDIQYFRSPPCFSRRTMLCRRVLAAANKPCYRRERLAVGQPSVELATVSCCEEAAPPRTWRRDCHTQVDRQPPPSLPSVARSARILSPVFSFVSSATAAPSLLSRSSHCEPFYQPPDMLRIEMEEEEEERSARRPRRWSLKRAFASLIAFLGLGRRPKSPPERPRRFELKKVPHDLGQRNVGLLFFKETDREDYRGRRFHVRRRTFTMRDERLDVACVDELSRELMDKEYRQRLLRQLRKTQQSCPQIS